MVSSNNHGSISVIKVVDYDPEDISVWFFVASAKSAYPNRLPRRVEFYQNDRVPVSQVIPEHHIAPHGVGQRQRITQQPAHINVRAAINGGYPASIAPSRSGRIGPAPVQQVA